MKLERQLVETISGPSALRCVDDRERRRHVRDMLTYMKKAEVIREFIDDQKFIDVDWCMGGTNFIMIPFGACKGESVAFAVRGPAEAEAFQEQYSWIPVIVVDLDLIPSALVTSLTKQLWKLLACPLGAAC